MNESVSFLFLPFGGGMGRGESRGRERGEEELGLGLEIWRGMGPRGEEEEEEGGGGGDQVQLAICEHDGFLTHTAETNSIIIITHQHHLSSYYSS